MRRALLSLFLSLALASSAFAQGRLLLLGVGSPAAGGGSFTTLTPVANGSGGTPTITIPGTPTAGNLCIIWNFAQSSGTTPSSVTPSGFTVLAEHSDDSPANRGIISAKILDGGETTVTGMDSTVERWIVATFTPNAAFSSFTPNGVQGESTVGNPVSQTIAASGAATKPVLLLGLMAAASGSVVDPRSTSPAMSEIAGSATNFYAHHFTYNSADTPANHTYDMDDEGGNNALQSLYVTFTSP